MKFSYVIDRTDVSSSGLGRSPDNSTRASYDHHSKLQYLPNMNLYQVINISKNFDQFIQLIVSWISKSHSPDHESRWYGESEEAKQVMESFHGESRPCLVASSRHPHVHGQNDHVDPEGDGVAKSSALAA
jgi:hypothetical protein